MQVDKSYTVLANVGPPPYLPATAATEPTDVPDPADPFTQKYRLQLPSGGDYKLIKLGPVLCSQVLPQRIWLCTWAWDGHRWYLLHTVQELWSQIVAGLPRQDSVVLPLPDPPLHGPWQWLQVGLLRRYVEWDTYTVQYSAIDAPRFNC